MSDNQFPLSESSTKEEVANYLLTSADLKEEVKTKLIDEYITGDILTTLTKNDLAGLGIPLGPRSRIVKIIDQNKDKIKEKEITEKIYPNSSKEEVKAFFEKSIDFKGELNSLDGKGLLELNETGMQSLGLKFGQRRRLIKYIDFFKTLKPPEEKPLSISRKSSKDEISNFLKLRLKFSQDSIQNIDIDAESLFDLKDEEIDELNEITSEEKEKLKQFLKEEFAKNEEEKEINLNLESSLEDICKFLKKKLCFSEEAIQSLKDQDLDVDTFLNLTEKEINDLEGVSEEEKEKLKIYLNEYKKEKEGKELKIDNKNSKEDVAKFLKDKLNFSETALKDWKLDGNSLLSLSEPAIDKLNELSQEEKENLKKFLAEQRSSSQSQETVTIETKTEVEKVKDEEKDDKIKKLPEDSKKKEKKEEEKKEETEIKISHESKKEDIIKFLEKYKLNLENLTEEKLEKINDIKKEEKEIIKTFLNKNTLQKKEKIDNNVDTKKKVQRANKIQDILYKNDNNNNPKVKTSVKKNDKKDQEKQNDKEQKKKEEEDFGLHQAVEEEVAKEERRDVLKFSHFKKFVVQNLINSPYNIFFFINLSDIQAKTAGISVYIDEGFLFNSYCIIKSNLISKNRYGGEQAGYNYCYLFQVPYDKQIKKLSIAIRKEKNGIKYTTVIDTNNIETFFQVNNLKYDSYDDFPFIDANSIISEYLDFFWDKNDDFGKKLKKSLVKAILNKISREYNIKIRSNNFFRILKLSAEFEIELKYIDNIEIKKAKIEQNYYITNKDIDKIISKKKIKNFGINYNYVP